MDTRLPQSNSSVVAVLDDTRVVSGLYHAVEGYERSWQELAKPFEV